MPEYDSIELEGQEVNHVLGANNSEKLNNLFDNTDLGRITLKITEE